MGEGRRALSAVMGWSEVATENPSRDRSKSVALYTGCSERQSAIGRNHRVEKFVRLDHRHRTGGYRRSRDEAHETTTGNTSHKYRDVEVRDRIGLPIGCRQALDGSTSNAPERSCPSLPQLPHGLTARLPPKATLSKDLPAGQEKFRGPRRRPGFVTCGRLGWYDQGYRWDA